MRVRAERHHGRGNIEGLAAVFDQADMIEPRVVADRDDQRIMGLIDLGALGRDVAFHQRRAGGLAELQQRTGEHRRGRATAGDMNHMQRLGQHARRRRPRSPRRRSSSPSSAQPSDWNCRARAVAPAARRRPSPALRAACGWKDLFAGFARSDSFGANTPSTSTSLRTPSMACSSSASPACVSAAASGAAASGSTSRISTRRSVYFQSSMRRCGRPVRS